VDQEARGNAERANSATVSRQRDAAAEHLQRRICASADKALAEYDPRNHEPRNA
jgi:hypothetical protein